MPNFRLISTLVNIMRRKPRSSKNPGDDFLPEAELEVLSALRELGEADTATLRKSMERYRPMAHASMATLLKRLEEKGLVSRRKADAGKAYLYSTTDDGNEIVRPLVSRLLDRVFRGDKLTMVATLFETRPPSKSELRELEELVRSMKSGKDRR